jgi:uncharacterized membrane protein
MSSLSLFRRRDPWWEADGRAARGERRRRRVVTLIAFAASLVAVGGAAAAWAIELGLPAMLGLHVTLAVG